MTLPWYPKDTGKYARKTKHLTMQEHGAYNLLLDCYYSSGGLPQPSNAQAMLKQCSSSGDLMPDHSRIYRACSAITKQEQDSVDNVLQMFFCLDEDGFYRNKEADETIEIQEQKHKNRVNAGKAGAQAKHKQCSSNADSNTPQTQIKTKKKKDSESLNDLGEKKREFSTELSISDKARQEAKSNAPGWDMYFLMRHFDENVNSGTFEKPKNINKAFPAWCKSFTKGKRPE